ncbi:alpha-glucosidase [Granulosicoccus antarcticus]|uniref:Oligo-1,6-glucosidase 1 n=1 Tax=Granulosicoccus antarcticus IMCC3135 TaxID=1192854 RepID=A0A2Z2NMF3_9GAMM|nr:alpha-glucosidase [Granulosicoccus antarcticus]ASJ71121.1 Oligo-1,6-glucosidase 1 [Granulosicoccus antarcticus IMCC3135]
MIVSSISIVEPDVVVDKDWWRGAVIYQIYPRSYQDSNHDGIGDLAGIKDRLPHIAELGADAIWISPFFKSPMKDFGYDVSNYKDIDPMFGDLFAFDELIEHAHALDLKVMVDLVLSHTSDQHSWFAQSSSSRDNDRHDWYVWADAKPDGGPPNNWLSIFGGPGWSWHSTRCQYYQHNFLSSQPDLNFHNPDVQDALLDVAHFWLDRGVDGFRLDTINFYFCDAELRDNPGLPPELRNADIAPEVNPYNHQEHLFDKNRPENINFLKRFRAVLDEYPAATAVGEVGDAQQGMQILQDYTRDDDRVHMCYTFDFLSAELPTAERVGAVLQKFEVEAGDSWVCWAFSNHDVVRHATRWKIPKKHYAQHLKMLASLLMSMRGSVCLYQGEELGLPEGDVPFERLQDPYGIAFWPKFKGRDGCRTPMVWDHESEHAGFSTEEPWLPVSEVHKRLSVSHQSGDQNSLLEHYRRFLSFRRDCLPLIKGTLHGIVVIGDVLSFLRTHEDQTVYCAFNMGNVRVRCEINTDQKLSLMPGHGFDAELGDGVLEIPPYSAAFVQIG